jgi:hypothetical protein
MDRDSRQGQDRNKEISASFGVLFVTPEAKAFGAGNEEGPRPDGRGPLLAP